VFASVYGWTRDDMRAHTPEDLNYLLMKIRKDAERWRT